MIKRLAIIIFLSLSLLKANAQFVNGIGIFAAGDASRHKWMLKDSAVMCMGEPYTDKFKGKNAYRYGGGIIIDFFSGDHFRWRTEFEYILKGSKDPKFTCRSVDDVQKEYFKNKLNYIEWNNFLIFRQELFSFVPYALVGPRVGYTFRNKPTVYENVLNNVPKFHFSWSAGAGIELVTYGNFKPYLEYHYNPDIIKLYRSSKLDVSNRTHELRLGLIYRFKKRKEACNTPIYDGSY